MESRPKIIQSIEILINGEKVNMYTVLHYFSVLNHLNIYTSYQTKRQYCSTYIHVNNNIYYIETPIKE